MRLTWFDFYFDRCNVVDFFNAAKFLSFFFSVNNLYLQNKGKKKDTLLYSYYIFFVKYGELLMLFLL